MARQLTYHWYNNGITQIQVKPGDSIPDGYVKGRLPRSPQALEAFAKAWSLKSGEEKAEINKKRSESSKRTRAAMSPEELAAIEARRKATRESRTPEQQAAYRAKISQGSKGKNRGKIPWSKGLTKADHPSIAHSSQIRSTYMKELWAGRSEEEAQEWRRKARAAMHENGTEKSSKPEDQLYQVLCDQYGEDGVVRHYMEDRYPFECDFYIPSEDLFIELNRHPSHGGHPFDSNNPEDIRLLEELEAKGDDWSRMIIDVWTRRDVRKFEIAKQNNLNYKVVY